MNEELDIWYDMCLELMPSLLLHYNLAPELRSMVQQNARRAVVCGVGGRGESSLLSLLSL